MSISEAVLDASFLSEAFALTLRSYKSVYLTQLSFLTESVLPFSLPSSQGNAYQGCSFPELSSTAFPHPPSCSSPRWCHLHGVHNLRDNKLERIVFYLIVSIVVYFSKRCLTRSYTRETRIVEALDVVYVIMLVSRKCDIFNYFEYMFL